MKSQNVSPPRVKSRGKDNSHPIKKVAVGNDFYIDLLNCLIHSILGDWAPMLDCMENLPRLVKAYEASANLVRNVDTDLYFRYTQCSCFLKKLELPILRDAAKGPALEKWLDAEASCKEMNAKIWEISSHPLTHSHDELDVILRKVAAEILSLIGEVPPDLHEVVHFMKFGPGATLTHSRDEGASVFKILNSSAYVGMEDEINFLAQHTLFRDYLLEANVPASCVLSIYDASTPQVEWFREAKYDTVPKSTSEERTIEIGPSLATFVQQGYDGFIRQQLRNRWGIDLRFQEPNKTLAYEGSIMGEKPNSPCTIDLSSASDRISYGVVFALLPPSWVRTLSRYRAKSILLPDGTSHTLEKFSSMGNALTFSLQTLIFSAVVRSILRERGWEGSRWRVYGDDIIVPRRAYEATVERLEALGFRVNQTKSFSSGHFRESCGGDYLHGTYVRPFYLKKPIRSVMDVNRLLNDLSLHAMLVPIPATDFEAVYRRVLSIIPKSLRVYGDTNTDPGSCIWTPSNVRSTGKFVERRVETLLPDKLAKDSKLLTGYTPFSNSGRSYTGGFLPAGLTLKRIGWGGRAEVLNGGLGAPIVAHTEPTAPGRPVGIYLRRAGLSGYTANVLPRDQLPFEPLLMD